MCEAWQSFIPASIKFKNESSGLEVTRNDGIIRCIHFAFLIRNGHRTTLPALVDVEIGVCRNVNQ